MKLGSILPEQNNHRGPDLRFKVVVPKSALGREGGYAVHVPRELEHQGEMVSRVCSELEKGETVKLQLPRSLPKGAVLRLRGQGGRLTEDGPAGDLFLEVEVQDVAWTQLAALAAGGLAVAGLLWWLSARF